jgi:hypothetical protein
MICRSGRDDSSRAGQAVRHCGGIVASASPFFPNPRRQEHLVVHGEAEQDREEHQRGLSAGLVATVIAGHRALAAVLLYRLISFWLVMAIGWTVMAVLVRPNAPGANMDAPDRA